MTDLEINRRRRGAYFLRLGGWCLGMIGGGRLAENTISEAVATNDAPVNPDDMPRQDQTIGNRIMSKKPMALRWPGGSFCAAVPHGATDESGIKAVDGRMHTNDLHATILALMGLDHRERSESGASSLSPFVDYPISGRYAFI